MSKLTAAKVKALDSTGTYGDGEGLYLAIARGGSKSWILRATVQGKRREIGLGGYPTVTLAKARETAGEYRAIIKAGGDPLAVKVKATATIPTFRQAAAQVHKLNIARFKSEKHGKNWIQMIEKYAFPTLGDVPVNQIEKPDVLAILTPIWTEKPETARRVRQRMDSIFEWARDNGHRKDNQINPARDISKHTLPAMPKVRQHFRALPYSEIGAALGTIRASNASNAAKLALEFIALTAARSGEVRGMVWAEVDWDKRLWVVPAERMKGGAEHRVPLSDSALDVLRQALELRETVGDMVFPSPMKAGSPLSDMTLTKILRTTGLAERMTVHGLRSTFRDWVAEQTATPYAVAELALAHRVGTAVEQAYHRTDLLDRRAALMDEWAAFLSNG